MKTPTFVKWCTTTVAALILSACGSSGDDSPSVSSAKDTNKQQPPVAVVKEDHNDNATKALQNAITAQQAAKEAAKSGNVAAAKAAVEQVKAAAQAVKDAAEKAKADNSPNAAQIADTVKSAEVLLQGLDSLVSEAQKVADAKLAQDNANKSIQISPIPVNNKASNVGYKHVVKTESDFILNGVKKPANNEANTGLLMQEQKPNENLDTFVIGHHRGEDGKEQLVYLEDVDTRQAEKPKEPKDDDLLNNKVVLAKAWFVAAGDANITSEREPRTVGKTLKGNTKTETQGKVVGAEALVYNEKQRIYLYAGKDEGGVTDSGVTDAKILLLDDKGKPKATDMQDKKFSNLAKNRELTTLELYGNKSNFALKTNAANTPEKYDEGQANEYKNAKNLPLEDKVLHYVQYGRVTSQLHGRDVTEFAQGLAQGEYATHIAPFGQYGKPGTENHYFARGTHNTTAEQVATLSGHYNTNKLVYKGHAVTYGVNHAFRKGSNDGRVPTALGGSETPYLISGTHVRANVDLATKLVDGTAYNIWGLAKNGKVENLTKVETPLVGFNGTLADNGNIAGTATNYTRNHAPGIFNATLFGPKGEEMGGTVVSANPDKVKWGMAFGATNVTAVPAATTLAPPPVRPIGGGVTGLLDSSDQQGNTQLVK